MDFRINQRPFKDDRTKAKVKALQAQLHPQHRIPEPKKGVLVCHQDLRIKEKAPVKENVKEKAKLKEETKAGI